MKLIKYVPNALSILRVLLSVALLFLALKPWLFTVVYLVIGATDVFDGKIARRFHVESNLGSKLDAIGDSMLFAGGAISMFFIADLQVQPLKCLLTISVAVAYKLANVAVTKLRFHEWNMMHTLMNRSVFVGIYCLVPVFFLSNEINYWLVLGTTVAICLACLEETITLLKLKEYDVNHRGILTEKILGRAA